MAYIATEKPRAPVQRHTVSSWKLLGVGFFVGIGWIVAHSLVIALNSPSFAKLCSAIGGWFE